MTQRAWYLRRGVAWQPVLGCCGAAVALVVMVAQWPAAAMVFLPLAVACCASAAAFVFDEDATAVVTVSPRGSGWRRTARVAVALLPLALWCVVVALRPGDLALSRPGWLLIGVAGVLTGAGLAAVASRRGVPRPGSALAALLTLAALVPVVSFGFLGLTSPYPLDGFPDAVRTTWLVVATAAGVVGVLACTPHVRLANRTVPSGWRRVS